MLLLNSTVRPIMECVITCSNIIQDGKNFTGNVTYLIMGMSYQVFFSSERDYSDLTDIISIKILYCNDYEITDYQALENAKSLIMSTLIKYRYEMNKLKASTRFVDGRSLEQKHKDYQRSVGGHVCYWK